MKIKKIKIKNFMGFSPEGEEIVLDDNLSIFVGENNSGKSGIGRAITFIQDYWKGLIVPSNMDGANICFHTRDGGDLLENVTHLSKKASEFEIEFKLELEEPELSSITDEFIIKSNQTLGVKITSDNESLNKLKDSIKDITVYAVCEPPFFDIFVKLNKHKIYINKDAVFTSNFKYFKHGSHEVVSIRDAFDKNDPITLLNQLKEDIEYEAMDLPENTGRASALSTERIEARDAVSAHNEVAKAVLSKSTWAVLALTCHIELFTQAHYKQSIEPGENLSELFKDVFLFHWREESQHAIIDELEWRREDKALNDAERDQAVLPDHAQHHSGLYLHGAIPVHQ